MPLELDTSTALVIVRIPTISPYEQHYRHSSNRYESLFDQTTANDIRPVQGLSWSHNYSERVEILFGCVCAAILFLVVLLVCVMRRQYGSSGDLKNVQVDKSPLVDEEVSANVDNVDRLTIHV